MPTGSMMALVLADGLCEGSGDGSSDLPMGSARKKRSPAQPRATDGSGVFTGGAGTTVGAGL